METLKQLSLTQLHPYHMVHLGPFITIQEIYQSRTQNIALLTRFATQLDWNKISREWSLVPATIEAMLPHIRWAYMRRNTHLPEITLTTYLATLNVPFILQNYPTLSPTFISSLSMEFTTEISQYPNLDREYIMTHADDLDWGELSRSQVFDDQFMLTWMSYIDWDVASEHQTLSATLLSKLHPNRISWNIVCNYQTLTPLELLQFGQQVTIYNIMWNRQVLSEQFIEECRWGVPWDTISYSQRLSESFMRRHQAQLNFSQLAISQVMSIAFIREFQDRIDFFRLSRNPHLSIEVLREFANDLFWDNVVEHVQLNTEALLEFAPRINWAIAAQYQTIDFQAVGSVITDGWVDFFAAKKIPDEFVAANADTIGWAIISERYSGNPQLLYTHEHMINWPLRIRSRCTTPEDLLRRHFEPLVFRFQKVSEQFIRDTPQVDWTIVCHYQRLSEPYLQELIDHQQFGPEELSLVAHYQELSEQFIFHNQDILNHRIVHMYQTLNASERFLSHREEGPILRPLDSDFVDDEHPIDSESDEDTDEGFDEDIDEDDDPV